jgi:hypothetical protein
MGTTEMTGTTNPKYEVAFSFLASDLQYAAQFADALAPLSAFVFSRRQEELAGTDGLESFRAAFRFDSRLNVVLFRQGWGETPWTRVEQSAIQERCLADGWDRLLVVKLDESPLARWIPSAILYLDLRTFPFEQAVGAIKRQVQFLGGKPSAPSPLDEARRTVARAKFEEETKQLFRTPEGISQADAAVKRVAEELRADLEEVARDQPWSIASGSSGPAYFVVRCASCTVLLNWERYANSAEDCELHARIIPVAIETPEEQKAGRMFMRFGRSQPVYDRSATIHRTMELGVCWRRGSEVLTPEQLAGELLKRLVSAVTRQQ